MRTLLLLVALSIAFAAPAASAAPSLGSTLGFQKPIFPDCVGAPCDLLSALCASAGRPWCVLE